MALWRFQHLHWNWYLYLPLKNIQFPKFYCWKSNNSLDHWEDNVYLRDLFLSNWFLFSTFSWENTMKIPNIFSGFCPKPHQGLQHPPPNPQLISDHFLKIVKKNRPGNFSLFRPLIIIHTKKVRILECHSIVYQNINPWKKNGSLIWKGRIL